MKPISETPFDPSVWASGGFIQKIIIEIEKTFKGWWYCLSQDKGKLTILMGPNASCPDIESLYLASTKEGDAGYRLIFDTSVDILKVFAGLKDIFLLKSLLVPEKGVDIRSRTHLPRLHTDVHFSYIRSSYNTLMEFLKQHDNKSYIVTEIYIGSCALSVDCSIRGFIVGGGDFDISADIQGAAGLEISIDTCFQELKYRIKHNI